jgi:hypothetical protein
MGLDRSRATATLAVHNEFGTPQSCDEARPSQRFEPGIPGGSVAIVIGAPRVEWGQAKPRW